MPIMSDYDKNFALAYTSGMNKVLKGAGVLAVCALIAKMIGAMYRIPLTNIVGAEGMGLYQMVFPLYTVLLTVSSGGLPVAISKVVSKKLANRDEQGARQVLFASLISLSLIGFAASLLVVLLREKIALVQGNTSASLPYLGIAPSLVFVAVISCFRGYYQGKQNMLPSAISQLVEQLVKLFLGLFFAKLLIKYGVEWAVLGALLGVSASELIAMSALIIQFLYTNKQYKKRTRIYAENLNFEAAAEVMAFKAPVTTKKGILREVYAVAIPVTLGSLVMPMTQVIDSILVINLLVAGGAGRVQATSLFGLMTGTINTLINMPIVIMLSLAVALLPIVSECFYKKKNPESFVAQGLKVSVVLGLFFTLVFAVFGKEIFSALYQKGLTPQQIQIGGKILVISSISILYVSILQVCTSVLQGASLAQKPALNLLYGAIFKIILTLALIPIAGITGAVAGTVLCYGITCILDVRDMLKVCPLKLKLNEFLFAPLASGGAFVVVGYLLNRLLSRLISPFAAVITAALIASAVFAVILLLLGGIKLNELSNIPLVGFVVKKLSKNKKSRKKTIVEKQ